MIRRIGGRLLLAGALIFASLPIVALVLASLSHNASVDRGVSLPFKPTFGQHLNILASSEARTLWPFAANSIVVSFGSTLVGLTCVLPIGVFYRYHTAQLRTAILACGALGLVIPTVLLLVPLTKVLGFLELNGSLLGLIFANASATLPFAIWLGCRCIEDVPKELSLAGVADGASPLRRALVLELPQARSGLALVAAFIFVLTWNDVLFSLFMSSHENRTLAAEASEVILKGEQIPRTATFAAVSMWTLLPAVLFLGWLMSKAQIVPSRLGNE